ncbi:MAG: hypothetical protein QW113_05265, partial [Candidatus Bathyarchaeia archaeon]
SAAPFGAAHLGHVTAKGNRVYLHVFYWPGKSEICVAGIKNRVVEASMLATGKTLPFEQREDRLFIKGLPRRAPDPIDTVIAIDLEGKPETVSPSFWMK